MVNVKKYLAVLLICVLYTIPATAKVLEIWHSQDIDPLLMREIAERFNISQQDVEVKFLSADVLMLSPSTLNKTRLPAALMLPSDKLAVEGFNFISLTPDWINGAVAQEFVSSVTVKQKIKGVPVLGGNQLMLFYNKQLVDEPATSWLQLLNQRGAVEELGADLLAFMCDGPFYLLPFLHAFDGGYFVKESPVFNTPENLQAMRWYQDMWRQGIFTSSCDATIAAENFAAGKLAYWLSTDSMNYSMEKRLGDKLGMTTLPTIRGKDMGGYFSTVAMAIPQQKFTSAEMRGLRRLANFLQSFEIQKIFFQQLKLIPVHERMFLSADLYPSKDFINSYLQLKKNKPMPTDMRLQVIWREVGKELRYFMRGAMTPEKFLSRTQRNIDRELAKEGL